MAWTIGIAALMLLAATIARAQDGDYPLTAEISAGSANVRTDSTVGAESICMVSRKQKVEIVGQAYDWYKIKLPSNAPAYVNQQYVEVDAEENDRGEISGDNVNIRLKPDIGSSILGQVQSGTDVSILGKSGNWYRIKPPETTTGWVHKSMVGKPLSVGATKQRQRGKKKEPAREPVQEPAPARQQEEVLEMIVVEGQIRPKVMTSVATHKIMSSQREVFLLRSNALDLRLFTGRQVRLTGTLKDDARRILEVLKVEELSMQQPEASDSQSETQAISQQPEPEPEPAGSQ